MKFFEKIRVTTTKATFIATMGAIAPVVLPIVAVKHLCGGGVKALKHDMKKAGTMIRDGMEAEDMDEWKEAFELN